MTKNFYLVQYYEENGGCLYDSRAAAFEEIIEKYLDFIKDFDFTARDIKADIRSLIDHDCIEEFAEIRTLPLMKGED